MSEAAVTEEVLPTPVPVHPAPARAWPRFLRWMPWLITALGVPLALYLWDSRRLSEQSLEQVRFDRQAAAVVGAIERTLVGNADLLRGVVGLFASDPSVTREQFRAYVSGLQLEQHYPGIQGVGYAQRVLPAQLADHQQAIRQSGLEGYAIRPPGPREVYSSIVYLEPQDWRNRRAIGFDMYAEPVRRTAMERAMLSGVPAMSGKVRLVQEVDQGVQAGFLIYTPLYRSGSVPGTPEDRREALVGWAYSPLRAGDLIERCLRSEFASLMPLLRLRIYSGALPDAEQLLYTSPGEVRAVGDAPRYIRGVTIHGQALRIEVEAVPAAAAELLPVQGSSALLIIGLLLTALLATATGWWSRVHRQLAAAYEATMQANDRLARNEAALRLAGRVMDASPVGIVVTDAQRRVVAVNPAFTRITGFQPEQALGRTPQMPVTASQPPAFFESLWQDVERQGAWQGVIENRRQDGTAYPQDLSLVRVSDGQGRTEHFVGLFSDVTERRKAEERIRHLAMHDYLTGLPNRAYFMEMGAQQLAQARRGDRRLAFLFLDLDRFKPINDTHGHEAGDAVLVEVAQRLRQRLRAADLVCRLGGDEFVVMLADWHDTDVVRAVAAALCASIEEPIHHGSLVLSVSTSLGMALYPEHGDRLEDLIQRADRAMYRAKAHPGTTSEMAGLRD